MSFNPVNVINGLISLLNTLLLLPVSVLDFLFGAPIRALTAIVAFSCVGVVGCNAHIDGESSEVRDQKHQHNLENVRELVQIGKDSGAAFNVVVRSSGRPSVGMKHDFYLNTGIDATLTIFGNLAAAPTMPPAPIEPAEPENGHAPALVPGD